MTTRPFLAGQVGALALEPFDGTGVRGISVARVVLPRGEPGECRVLVLSPRTEDGAAPPRPSRVLAFEPTRVAVTGEELDEDEPAAFEWDGDVMRARILFRGGTSFYGAGLVPGPLLRNGRAITLWNTDAWCYGEETPALYQSHPFVLALRPDGSAVGLIADASAKGALSIGTDGVEFSVEGEPFELYRIDADGPAAVVRGLSSLVGRVQLPPLWALGYHQCRWSYASALELEQLAAEFRDRCVPCDALWLDIDHMDRHRVFTWNREAFPDPAGMTARLRSQGFRTIAILDPGVARDEDYEVHRELVDGEHHVRTAAGAPATGRVWPGICSFPDFTAERTRAWWSDRVTAFARDSGLDGLWTDMNEPSLFRTPARTLPESSRHAAGSHLVLHNLYGQEMARATRAGLEVAHPDRRPFVLTRSNHLSGMRFAATWTGDNQSRWEDLSWSLPMSLSLGLSGQPFSGSDVGGFFGDPSPELFARWFEAGALLPFFRGHAERSSCRKEPWAFGDETLEHVRRAIELRMRLLPTLYTLFHRAAQHGDPIVQPLFFAAPADPALRAVDDAFLLGDALLVAPVLAPGALERDVPLPAHPWYSFPDGVRHAADTVARVPAPLGRLPMFARAGSIVVECELRERAGAWTDGFGDGLRLHAFLDADGRATGELYEDAGDGFGYRAGDYTLSRLEVESGGDGPFLTVRSEGARPPRERMLDLIVHGGAEPRALRRLHVSPDGR